MEFGFKRREEAVGLHTKYREQYATNVQEIVTILKHKTLHVLRLTPMPNT